MAPARLLCTIFPPKTCLQSRSSVILRVMHMCRYMEGTTMHYLYTFLFLASMLIGTNAKGLREPVAQKPIDPVSLLTTIEECAKKVITESKIKIPYSPKNSYPRSINHFDNAIFACDHYLDEAQEKLTRMGYPLQKRTRKILQEVLTYAYDISLQLPVIINHFRSYHEQQKYLNIPNEPFFGEPLIRKKPKQIAQLLLSLMTRQETGFVLQKKLAKIRFISHCTPQWLLTKKQQARVIITRQLMAVFITLAAQAQHIYAHCSADARDTLHALIHCSTNWRGKERYSITLLGGN